MKKIFILALTLSALIALALGLIYKTRPGVGNHNPLRKVDVSHFSKIVLTKPTEIITLEKKNNQWLLTTPLDDVADDANVVRLCNMLKNMELGSVVSQNPDRYSTYDVESGTATNLKVYGDNGATPLFDGYIGKMGPVYNTSFVRLEKSAVVYIASPLPPQIAREPAKDYRLRPLINTPLEKAMAITVLGEKINFSMTRSSMSWVNAKTGAPLEATWVEGFIQKLSKLEANDFAGSGETIPTPVLGFLKPTLTLSVETSSGPIKGLIGSPFQPLPGQIPSASRYAQTEGRKAVLLIAEPAVQDVLIALRSLPTQ